MANPHRGEMDFVAGQQTYRLRFSTNAICEAESALGKSIVDISEEMAQGKISMSVVRAMLWAGLHDAHPHMTIREAGDLIEPGGGMLPVYQLIGQAMALAFPSNVSGNPTVESQANGKATMPVGGGLDS